MYESDSSDDPNWHEHLDFWASLTPDHHLVILIFIVLEAAQKVEHFIFNQNIWGTGQSL